MIPRKMQLKIHATLREKGITQASIARELGVSLPHVNAIINGYQKPYGKVRDYLLRLMGMTLKELCSDPADQTNTPQAPAA